MSEVDNLEKLRGHLVSARRQQVAKALGSKSLPNAAAGRLKTTQDIIDALDRAIMDEKRLNPPPVQQPQTGTVEIASDSKIGVESPPHHRSGDPEKNPAGAEANSALAIPPNSIAAIQSVFFGPKTHP
jgi:hypothetical protein